MIFFIFFLLINALSIFYFCLFCLFTNIFHFFLNPKPSSLPPFTAKLSFSTLFLSKSNGQSVSLSLSIRRTQFLAGMAYAATVVPLSISFGGSRRLNVFQKRRSLVVMSASAVQQFDLQLPSKKLDLSVMVNSCSGKMGKAVIKAADSAGLQLVPVSFGCEEEAGKTVEVCGKEIHVHGPSDRESVLASAFREHPNMIVVDYTVPDAVNSNAELYSKIGVPFVMGTTGGDRDLLYKTVKDSNIYAVISPQMGKQVVAFLAAMEIMAEQFPGAFSGYSLQVMESHQTGKLDTSGTAKAVVSCFEKLGVSFDMDQIQMIRDPQTQLEMVGVPEEFLPGHAFHMYHLTSPDQTVSFEFQHNVCGRSIYAEGTIDAVLFLAKKVQANAEKKIYNMIDVLREGNMR